MKLFTNINSIIEHAKSQFGESFSKKTSTEDYASQFDNAIYKKYDIKEMPVEMVQQVERAKNLYVYASQHKQHFSKEQNELNAKFIETCDKSLEVYFGVEKSERDPQIPENAGFNKDISSKLSFINSTFENSVRVALTIVDSAAVIQKIQSVNEITGGLLEQQRKMMKEPKM